MYWLKVVVVVVVVVSEVTMTRVVTRVTRVQLDHLLILQLHHQDFFVYMEG